MTDKDKITIHIDSAEIHEDIPQTDKCPQHPDVEPEVGFGMAGGGYGPYTFCPICGKMLSKSQDNS